MNNNYIINNKKIELIQMAGKYLAGSRPKKITGRERKQELVQTLGKDLADHWLIQTLDHFEKPTVGLVLMC